MKVRYPNTILIICILFLGCKNNDEEMSKRIVGKWNVERDVYTKGSVILNTDQTFKFYEVSHLSETYSTGNWKIKNDTLLLNSKMPTECLFINHFSPYCEDKYIVIKPHIETTIENCEPKNYGKFYTKFSNEKFVFKNDSLTYINENKNCANQLFPYKIFK